MLSYHTFPSSSCITGPAVILIEIAFLAPEIITTVPRAFLFRSGKAVCAPHEMRRDPQGNSPFSADELLY